MEPVAFSVSILGVSSLMLTVASDVVFRHFLFIDVMRVQVFAVR